MPVINSATSIFEDNNIALTVDNDTLTVTDTGYVISTMNTGVELQNVAEATVNGTVLSNGTGFFAAMAQTEDVNLDLTVGATGTIHGRSIGFYSAFNTDIDNKGKISATDGAGILHAGDIYYIDNFGLISSADSSAVLMTGAGIHVINNSGAISATTANTFAIRSTSTTAVDSVGNFGNIFGDINLGGGNDAYNGASGRVFGKVYGGTGNDELTGGAIAEDLIGGTHNDTLTGNGGNDELLGQDGLDFLYGGAGDDELNGGIANDLLSGGTGFDTLTGGAGKDTFLFNVALTVANRDVLTDFSAADDTIRLENSIFKQMTATGTLNKDFFKLSTQTQDANDYIIYNKASGAVYYDADGSGAGGALLVATLLNKPTIGHADFFVV